MTGLKKMLLQEQERLENILSKTKKQLESAPQGTLRLSGCKKWIQYYHCMPGCGGKGEYIPKSECDRVRSLAQKSYDEKVVRLAEKRLSQIKKIVRDYDEEEMEKIFWREHRERQKWIEPVEIVWEKQLEEWLAKDFEGKEFQEGIPIILAERGERVRSKSEKILADYFYRRGIPYKYEKPLYLKHFGTVYPDFTFLSKRTRKEIYWEHDGRMDDPVYAQSVVRKIQAYEENDIYPGEQLILTFETEKQVLNTREIERLVRRYLL